MSPLIQGLNYRSACDRLNNWQQIVLQNNAPFHINDKQTEQTHNGMHYSCIVNLPSYGGLSTSTSIRCGEGTKTVSKQEEKDHRWSLRNATLDDRQHRLQLVHCLRVELCIVGVGVMLPEPWAHMIVYNYITDYHGTHWQAGVKTCTAVYSASQNNHPSGFLTFVLNCWKYLVLILQACYVLIYTIIQIFIQLPATSMELCYIKHDHPVHMISSKCPPSVEWSKCTLGGRT